MEQELQGEYDYNDFLDDRLNQAYCARSSDVEIDKIKRAIKHSDQRIAQIKAIIDTDAAFNASN